VEELCRGWSRVSVAMCSRRRTLALRRLLTKLVELLAIEEHLDTALGQQGAESWPTLYVVSERR
jgi:hypothetical protein